LSDNDKPLTDEEIREALQVCEQATPGPWVTHKGRLYEWRIVSDGEAIVDAEEEQDARFIALARDLLPRVLAEVQAQRARIAQIEQLRRDDCDNYTDVIRIEAEEGLRLRKIVDAITPEPASVKGGDAVWPAVICDMQARDMLGRERYGTPLQTGNERRPLVDAYQEALDLCVYLKQELMERGCSIPVEPEQKPPEPVGKCLERFESSAPGAEDPEVVCQKESGHGGFHSASVGGKVYTWGEDREADIPTLPEGPRAWNAEETLRRLNAFALEVIVLRSALEEIALGYCARGVHLSRIAALALEKASAVVGKMYGLAEASEEPVEPLPGQSEPAKKREAPP